jgi:hypothetical protein
MKTHREAGGDDFRIDFPVKEAEAGPALLHDGEACGSLRLGEAL